MSSKKKEKESWTECEHCHHFFPRVKFSLHDQDACRPSCDSTDGEQTYILGKPADLGLPHVGFVYCERFFGLCSTYKIDGWLTVQVFSSYFALYLLYISMWALMFLSRIFITL